MTTAPTPAPAAPTPAAPAPQQPAQTPPKSSFWDWRFVMPLLFSSLAGALVTIYVQENRAKIPTVHYSMATDRIFSATGSGQTLKATLTIPQDDKTFQFTNLSIVKLKLTNNTRKDYSTFKYGVTLPRGHEIIRCEKSTKDRLHDLTVNVVPTPANPVPNLDFAAEPFNRTDEYTVILYVHSPEGPVTAEQVKVVSPESVKWATGGSGSGAGETTPRSTTTNLLTIGSIIVMIILALGSLASNIGDVRQKASKQQIDQLKSAADSWRQLAQFLTTELHKGKTSAPDVSSGEISGPSMA